jgi:voltage-gated sodium channel
MLNRSSLKSLVDSSAFHKAVSLVIILCAVVLGIETRLTDPYWQRLFIIVDILITTFFIIEITLRILAEKSILHFFHLVKVDRCKQTNKLQLAYSEEGFWNWFDFVITAVSGAAIFTHFFAHPEYLLIARMFRIFRIFRLLEISSQLKEIEKKIVAIIPTVFSFALLLFILIYIYSIIGFYLFEGKDMDGANFSTLFDSAVTLFQVMTLDGWGELMLAVNEADLAIPTVIIDVYFISFVVITAIVSLNVFIAVLASSVETRISKDVQDNQASLSQLIKDEADQAEIEVEEGFRELLAEMRDMKSAMAEIRKKLD